MSLPSAPLANPSIYPSPSFAPVGLSRLSHAPSSDTRASRVVLPDQPGNVPHSEASGPTSTASMGQHDFSDGLLQYMSREVGTEGSVRALAPLSEVLDSLPSIRGCNHHFLFRAAWAPLIACGLRVPGASSLCLLREAEGPCVCLGSADNPAPSTPGICGRAVMGCDWRVRLGLTTLGRNMARGSGRVGWWG
ncbi:uncharacterized protein BDZ99DRAFT_526279 [Mytilinidion resinicola]|uniref:Uncharacterized protein n=1 Tax=Mytilinidion resinicola TaxID=574789 RepID=A0A6A6Y5K6_9PEZI|nr:uncharacterized protein BDZ99DRAFT_526279 [Mytilinidion resinicola]KAF2803808.1 hypothetical protein BDZ99DRAFT_526279 [Mytilinidion resinicola]